MPKPLGVALTVGEGGIGMHVTAGDRVSDKVWDAVEEAYLADWTPEKFIAEVKQAWEQAIDDDAKRKKEDLERSAPRQRRSWE